ncbi:MAG: MotA/TolQ/ExbB proton channel family protein [Candidatus Calescibacterium sp.]|nr:MotA/TolQ/ExbB proton channel family protein [Candidatus Calescibacterium sp.]MCX7734347.1 MotA/TolQ/ExbB proton channel family protein [bacterium]MDW8087618.1 MotA/TolQ/ExbB proton channel family protein [Candidatus Calescibacterium sp.]
MIKEALLHASLPVKVVILILFSSSVVLWALIIYNFIWFLKMERKNTEFIDFFWSQQDLKDFLMYSYGRCDEFYPSPLARLCSEVGVALSKKKKILRFIEQEVRNIISDISRFQFIYATIGSSAPFVGLFGTVWGIMHSFRDIAKMGRAGLEVVAPGIAEALFTTALGLFVAIPAVIAYNFFQNKLKKMSGQLETLSTEIEREIDEIDARTSERASDMDFTDVKGSGESLRKKLRGKNFSP